MKYFRGESEVSDTRLVAKQEGSLCSRLVSDMSLVEHVADHHDDLNSCRDVRGIRLTEDWLPGSSNQRVRSTIAGISSVRGRMASGTPRADQRASCSNAKPASRNLEAACRGVRLEQVAVVVGRLPVGTS